MSRDASVFDAVERGAAVFRAPQLGTLAVTGKDRVSWLNGLLTCDVTHLSRQSAAYGLLLVKVGRILTDMWLLDAGDRILVGLPADRIALAQEHLEKYLMMEDAAHTDASKDFAWIFAHGPLAASLAAEVLPRHGGYSGELDLLGTGGAVSAVPVGATDAVLAEMAGRASAEAPVVVGSASDWEAVSVVRALPRFGVDFSEKNYPQEASIERLAVSFSKGCYLGQEVVCRLEMRGHVIKKIVALELADGDLPAPGTEVRSVEGKPLGTISSAASAPSSMAPRALAMVRYDFTEPGTSVDVSGRPGKVLAPR